MSRAALRALEVLSFVAHAREPVRVADVCARTGLKRATAYRLVEEMVNEGWLKRSGRPARYAASLRTAELGLNPLSRNPAREVMLWHAAELTAQLGTRTAIGFYEDGFVLYTDLVDMVGGKALTAAIGQRMPAACTTAGKALLACQPHEEIERVAARGLRKYQRATRTSPSEILQDILLTRERGYAIADREYGPETSGVGMAVRDVSQAAVGAIVVGSFEPITEDFVGRVLPGLRAAAINASAELGYRPAMSQGVA